MKPRLSNPSGEQGPYQFYTHMKLKIKTSVPLDKDKPHNGWSNYDTYWTAHVISNDENLYNLCKAYWLDGYKSWGSLSNKMREFGHKWQSNYTGINSIYWKDSAVRGPEITKYLKDLFQPNK